MLNKIKKNLCSFLAYLGFTNPIFLFVPEQDMGMYPSQPKTKALRYINSQTNAMLPGIENKIKLNMSWFVIKEKGN
jgi:hypothetical protein